MKHVIEIPDRLEPVQVLGTADALVKTVETGIPNLDVWVRDREIRLTGEAADVTRATAIFTEIVRRAGTARELNQAGVRRILESLPAGSERVVLHTHGKTIAARSPGQQAYSDAIDNATVVFGIGPAGTGKTFLAIAHAVRALLAGDVRRIVLTRPAVEAGENLGFLPGTLTEKIDPYLRPLYDALRELMDGEELNRLMDSGVIEVAPLAYMRGRTLNDSFIVLDEAQNTSTPQMKMFLTRLGFNSKMVVTGDVSQIDLPRGTRSGLVEARQILKGISGIDICELGSVDVVRHRIVGEIIDAYEQVGG